MMWGMDTLVIDCDDCRLQGSDACGDCLVSLLCGPPEPAVVIDAAEANVVQMLGRSGLVPPIRHIRKRAVPA